MCGTVTKVQNPRYIKQLLDINNVRKQQKHDIICFTIFYYLKHPEKCNQKLSRHFKFIMSLIKKNAFYINTQGLLCIRPDSKYPHHRLVIPQSFIKIVLYYVHAGT